MLNITLIDKTPLSNQLPGLIMVTDEENVWLLLQLWHNCGYITHGNNTALNTTMRPDTLLSEKSFEGRLILGYRLIQLIH